VKQLVRWIPIFTTGVLVALVALLILNLISFISIVVYHRCYPTYSLDDLQDVYPGMTQADIRLLLDETRERPFQYEPWVGFKERARSGTYVNVSDQGFRFTCEETQSLESEGIRVFVFGGSTTFGHGLGDSETIPAHLQRHLSELYPSHKIQVFNFGRRYYYSLQEATLLVQLIREGRVPTVAVFIDGLNEGQSEPHYTKEMRFIFDALNGEEHKLVGAYLSQTSLMRVIRKVMPQSPKRVVKWLDPEEVLSQYQMNKRHIKALGELHGFRPYFFIQPVPGYRNPYLEHKLMIPRMPLHRVAFLKSTMSLLRDTVNHQDSFDLTGLLEHYGKQPFVDKAHYTSKVCDLIAREIANSIEMSSVP